MSSTRRSFAAAITGTVLAGCTGAQSERSTGARVLARPADAAPASPAEPGLHALNLRPQRDTLLYIPRSTDPAKPAPLLVYLHGATGSEQQGISKLKSFADDLGFLLLSPASERGTWDAIQGGYGPDVHMMDQSLACAFAMRRVDPRRIALAGFSDGASYALGLGLSNGTLFGSLLAFSPGFIPPGASTTGKPRIFVSHGTKDTILPIESCSRRLVPQLKLLGYSVTYREFEGPHTAPREMIEEGLKWFLG